VQLDIQVVKLNKLIVRMQETYAEYVLSGSNRGQTSLHASVNWNSPVASARGNIVWRLIPSLALFFSSNNVV
jgi:hypothetical protein